MNIGLKLGEISPADSELAENTQLKEKQFTNVNPETVSSMKNGQKDR